MYARSADGEAMCMGLSDSGDMVLTPCSTDSSLTWIWVDDQLQETSSGLCFAAERIERPRGRSFILATCDDSDEAQTISQHDFGDDTFAIGVGSNYLETVNQAH